MSAVTQARVFLFASLGLVVASSATFCTLAWRNAPQRSGVVARVQLSAAPYVATVGDAPPGKTEIWNPPAAQSRGRDWIYDTFTPPEIFYNPRTQLFTVKPPANAADETVDEPFGLELVAVRPEPFRLQLIGYVGGEGNWRGTFENLVSGEVFLAGAGRRVPDLALSIKSLEVTAVPVALQESMTTRQRVALAVVHDDRTGRDITLTHRERRFTGGLSALLARPGDSSSREVREGEKFKLGAASYRVEKIQLAPPAVDVTKESPTLAQPDRRTLAPRETEDAPLPTS
jgi:hypothetical protein